MNKEDPDWPQIREQVVRLLGRDHARPDVEDAAEDGVLAAWLAWSADPGLRDPVAFALVVARRRLADRYRRRGRTGSLELVAEDSPALVHRDDQVELGDDWAKCLRDFGAAPTQNWSRILELIAAGVNTNKGLARALGRDVKSVKESRWRLQEWLRRLASPPPVNDMSIVRMSRPSLTPEEWMESFPAASVRQARNSA